MPKYRVQSGALNHVVETPYPAQPQAIAVMAFLAKPRANNLGQLTEIRGGEYTGDNITYVLTEKVLSDMGMMEPSNVEFSGQAALSLASGLMDGLGIIYGRETEMHELKVGDKLKDNDPRMGDNRILTIVELLPNGVVAENGIGQRRRYLRKRIHTDGKARRSGMNLLMPNELNHRTAAKAD